MDLSHKYKPEDSYKFVYVGHVTIRIFSFLIYVHVFAFLFFGQRINPIDTTYNMFYHFKMLVVKSQSFFLLITHWRK